MEGNNGKFIERFKGMNPPSFAGATDLILAEQWIMELEKIFDVFSSTSEQKVQLATFMFKGVAEHWWRLKKGSLRTPILWEAFGAAFYEKNFSNLV